MEKNRPVKFPWIKLDDGRYAKFDWKRFFEEVVNATREKRCSQSDIFRGITKLLHPEYSRDEVEDKFGKVKKWYAGNNGPRNLAKIYRTLSEYFGCEDDAFLIYKDAEEEYAMNTATTQTNQARANDLPPTASESRLLIRAMERAREKEVAHELYGMLVDLIAAYLVVDGAVWGTYNQEQEWKTRKIEEYPSCYSVELAIIKSSMYLPKEVRYRVEALLEDLYGEYGERTFVWQKGDHFSNGLTYDKLREIKHTQFEEYLKQKGKDPQNLNHFQETALWVTMISDEENELFDRLDDIFADYLCD